MAMVTRGIVKTRSQAESYVKLGKVKIDGQIVTKPGYFVGSNSEISLSQEELYVSRAALKLASVARQLNLNFQDKIVLDVGSSTGGFTDYAIKHGAAKVIAVDVGTEQMHPNLRNNSKVELHEKTDIRNLSKPTQGVDIVLIDVSFISLKEVLPAVAGLVGKNTQIVAMCKPQFEAGMADINKGIIKNDTIRRKILSGFEDWVKKLFIIADKAESKVSGAKGNLEKFYLLKKRLK
ncbi:TlyA family RNA methyltransferase [Candidatus Saccharibacteria bacterium]|nr:TlyA family RNA methyltransferase [Candidatus Saccharibacteria bacterium]